MGAGDPQRELSRRGQRRQPGECLTQTLRVLERDGLVSRTMTPAVPVRVDYALTPLGESLMPAVNAVKSWAEEHMAEIEASRAGYDRRSESSQR